MGKVMTTENTGGIVSPPQRPRSSNTINETIERCAQELKHLEQHKFADNDQFAIGFNEAIRQAQVAIRALMKNEETK